MPDQIFTANCTVNMDSLINTLQQIIRTFAVDQILFKTVSLNCRLNDIAAPVPLCRDDNTLNFNGLCCCSGQVSVYPMSKIFDMTDSFFFDFSI